MALLIFHRVTFVSNYHEGGAERPLANLSAVNYGNLPSCLSASAAGLPFVSKSKAPICNISTFSFLQGHGAHERLTTGDIYSSQSLRPPLQKCCTLINISGVNNTAREHKAKAGPEQSGSGISSCWTVFSECGWEEGGDGEKYRNTQTQHLCWCGCIMGIELGFVLKWHKASEKRSKTAILILLHAYVALFYSCVTQTSVWKNPCSSPCATIIGQVRRPKHRSRLVQILNRDVWRI